MQSGLDHRPRVRQPLRLVIRSQPVLCLCGRPSGRPVTANCHGKLDFWQREIAKDRCVQWESSAYCLEHHVPLETSAGQQQDYGRRNPRPWACLFVSQHSPEGMAWACHRARRTCYFVPGLRTVESHSRERLVQIGRAVQHQARSTCRSSVAASNAKICFFLANSQSVWLAGCRSLQL